MTTGYSETPTNTNTRSGAPVLELFIAGNYSLDTWHSVLLEN